MATAAVGANQTLAYVAETSFGVTPTSPSMKLVRAKSGSKFELKRDTFTSKELNPGRQVMGLTYGNRSGSAELPFEFSYASFDDFMQAVLGGTWTANILKMGTTARSFTFEQGYPDINLREQNTGVVVNGFSLSVKPNAIVEGSFSGMFKDQGCVQYADDGTTTMAFDGTAKTITRSAGSFVTDGFAVGQTVVITGAANAANNQAIVLSGVAATVLTASTATMVTDTAKTGVTIARKLAASYTAANTNEVFDAFTGTLLENGVAMAIATGIDIKIDQGGTANFALFSATAQSVSLSTINVTGTLVVRFINNNLKKKFLAGTASALTFTLGSGSAKSYTFDMSNIKYTSAMADTGENELTQTLNFQAIYDATDASSMVITRIP